MLSAQQNQVLVWRICEVYLCQLKQWGAVPLEGGAGGPLLAPSLAIRLLKHGLLSPLEFGAESLVSEVFV